MSRDLFWTYPLRMEINEDGKTVYDLVDEYKLFLEGHHPERANSFDILCRNQPESARTEAVVFAFLMWNDYDIAVEETPDGGGVDFRVRNGNTEFVVEATSILRDTFTNRSNVPEDPWASGRGVHVDPYDVCHKVRQKVAAKAEQMSGYGCPTILVIACEHGEYQTCLKKDEDVGIGADSFLTSPRVLGLPDLNEVTYLDDSLFLRSQNGRIVFCRQSISAVLLMFISKYHSQTTGLLHPKPAYNFSSEWLPLVPFVEVVSPESLNRSHRIGTRWIPVNLPDGSFIYNQDSVETD